MSLKHAGCFVDFERCACVQGNITDMTLGPLSRGKLKIEEEGEGGGGGSLSPNFCAKL